MYRSAFQTERSNKRDSWIEVFDRIVKISRDREGLLLFSAADSVNVIGQVFQDEFNDGRKRGLLYNSRYFFLSFPRASLPLSVFFYSFLSIHHCQVVSEDARILGNS